MSVTGVLLTYEKQMIRWADGYHTPPAPGQQRLALESFAPRAVASRPGVRPQSVILRQADDAPVEVSVGREGTVYLHPYTGEVLGTGSTRARAFFRGVMDWHRWLGRTDDQRSVGRAITGAANLGFFFIVVSGFYLWWPRTWTWPQFRQVLLFRRRLAPKARDFNWHHVVGFWSLAPLAVIVWSGVVISYPWASNLTYQLAGEAPPPPGPPGGRPAAAPRGGPMTPSAVTALDPLVARAAALHPDWKAISVPLPVQPGGRVALGVDRGTGEWYGLTGQTIAGVVTLGSLVLIWTGVALSLRRCIAWLTRRTAVPRQGVRPAA